MSSEKTLDCDLPPVPRDMALRKASTVSVVVVTHNRERDLAETLASVARLDPPAWWELIVADNGSVDGTAALVERATHWIPCPVVYLRHDQPGKYGAFNEAIRRARGSVIAATDDDASPERDWLTRALEGLERFDCDFVGGRAVPVWAGGQPPVWLDHRHSITGKVLGLLDYGDVPREFGIGGIGWPLGVNVAYRRDAFRRAGLFNPRLGRRAGTLLNQSQREWHLRARQARLRGFYIPGMVVHHKVSADRLTPAYFRRWFYWHGISRALLQGETGYDLENPDGCASAADAPHVLGVPRGMLVKGARALLSALRRRLRGQRGEALDYELYLCFLAGVLRQQWRDRRALPAARRAPPALAAVKRADADATGAGSAQNRAHAVSDA